MRAAQLLILGPLLVACGAQPQNTGSMPSTDDLWEAREGQSVIFLDRNRDVIYGPTQQLQFELLEGDSFCRGLTPQTTCISLPTNSEAEAQQRTVYYGQQLENQGWRPLRTGNQYARDVTDQCRAIVAIGATIRPDGSIDWSEIGFIQSINCRESAQ